MPPITLSLPENTQGRDFVIGDVHGAFDVLDKALARAAFNPEKDRLISVGDLVDRGQDSPRCLEFLKKPWFFAVRGNHEDMFLNTYQNGTLSDENYALNIRNGMGWMYETDTETLEEIRAAFEKLPCAIDVPTPRGRVGFVHAEVPLGMDWQTFKQKLNDGDEHTIETALWGRTRIHRQDTSGIEGIDRLFCGHTPQESGATRLGNCYYIDTGAVFRDLLRIDNLALTFSDIMAKTMDLSRRTDSDAVNLKLETPEPQKPFGQYAKKRTP